MNLPKARTVNLIEQNLDKETLIYDLNTHKAFNLNKTSTIVYRACNSGTTFDDLKTKHYFTDDFIFLALDELKRNNLLEDNYHSPINGTNRREMIKKVGLASMIMLPMITGLVAPTAANAASNTANNNSSGGDRARGNYDQVCISNIYGPYCNGDLRCVPTTSGEERCCEFSTVNGSVRHYSGGKTTQTNGPIYMRQETAITSDNTSCQYNLACCDGRTSYGTCTYAPDTTNEYDEKDYAGFEQSGFYPYTQTCTCTCP